MIIGAAADQIIAELGYQSVEKKLDRRNVIVRMDAVRSELMAIMSSGGVLSAGTQSQTQIRPNKSMAYDFPDVFYVSKTAPILFDNTRARYFSNMPTEYVAFGNNNGIRAVRLAQDNVGSNYLISQVASASVSYGELESSMLGGLMGYEIEGMKLFYNNMPANQYTEMLITYIPSLLALRETDILPCTGEFASVLLDRTRDSFLMQKGTREDKAIDGQSN